MVVTCWNSLRVEEESQTWIGRDDVMINDRKCCRSGDSMADPSWMGGRGDSCLAGSIPFSSDAPATGTVTYGGMA